MLRLPLVWKGLVVVGTVATATGALADVSTAVRSSPDGTNTGPLIIRIERSSAPSQGDSAVIKQTRCLLQWTAGEPGKYTKQCSTSALPH